MCAKIRAKIILNICNNNQQPSSQVSCGFPIDSEEIGVEKQVFDYKIFGRAWDLQRIGVGPKLFQWEAAT